MGFFDYYVRFRKRNVKRSKLSPRSLLVCSISDLSDELLIKILSFLPTRVAVSTSILSKQWQFLWMWLPKLEYSSRSTRSYYSNSSALREFIDKNLPLHRAPVIERLSLYLISDKHTQPEGIKRWVEIAVSRNVRDLDIDYYLGDGNIFPSSFYTCNSLVILKLRGMALIDVPSLKTLDLQYLTYQHDDSLQGLLDICPVLEDLSVNFCEEQHNIPSLKYFKLVDWNYWRHDDIEIKDMPKLEESICECCILCSQECHWIHHICQASYYMLRDPKKWSVFDLVYSGGFVFNQLKHLKQCVCKKNSSHLLDQLLKDSPNLRVLDISHMERHGYDGLNEMVCWNQPSPVPECLLSSLQILNWSRYFGRPQDRDIAVYILKHARRLNKAKIIADTMEHNVQNLEMITELAFSSRASSRCELVFVKQGKEDLMW